MNKGKGYRTFAFNLLGVNLAILQASMDVFPPAALPVILALLASGNTILRLNTNTAFGQKEVAPSA